MTTDRMSHTATLLNNGMVLVAGGLSNATSYLASAELYDPVTGTFTPTGSLNQARETHTATLLNNGMVLVAGGIGPTAISANSVLTSAELYDPVTGTFTPTGSLNTPRAGHTATLLNNGTVLVAAGISTISCCSISDSAELYDPATATFSLTGSMSTARSEFTATLLNNGTVLIAGGSGLGPTFASAELYEPTTGTFTLTGSLNTARISHTATLLNNGSVIVAGGSGNTGRVLTSAELYDPVTGTFAGTGNLNTARHSHTATSQSNGTVLVVGGIPTTPAP